MKSITSLENKVRKLAKEAGYLLKKSRAAFSADNLGEYMLVENSTNAVICGSRYDATLEEIQEYLAGC